MWKICFEDSDGNVADELEFSNFGKARKCFDAIVLEDFAKAVLIRENGTFLALKEKK